MPQEAVDTGTNPAVQPDIPVPAPDLSGLTLDTGLTADAMRHNSLVTATAKMRDDNDKLKAAFLNSTWADYVGRMQSGQRLSPELQVPPKPPVAFVLSPPDADGNVSIQPGNEPMCPMPPVPTYLGGLLPTVPIPNHIHIGAQIPGTLWFQAGDDDGVPSGQEVPNPDSPSDGHLYEKFGSPFRASGKGGLYLQVK
jgi:hypothetical protein